MECFSKIPGPEIPLGLITKIEKTGSQNKKETRFQVNCQDIRTHQFSIALEQNKKSFLESLQETIFPPIPQEPFAFTTFNSTALIKTNPPFYSYEAELNRLISRVEHSGWRISKINSNFHLCPSYPSIFSVPVPIQDENLENASKFRIGNRFPTLSWIHPTAKSTICRSSQPRQGPFKRNEEDEQLISAIRLANPKGEKLYIFDARAKSTVVVPQVKGTAYEDLENYVNVEINFIGLPSLQSLRESFQKISHLCFPNPEEAHWHANVEGTGWIESLKQLIQTATAIANIVHKRNGSVLIHCLDGWDRTPQLTSLAMLLLDPYYRTISGFCILLEKEWIAFGHKFSKRVGGNDEQRSPVLIQFLDCVYQLITQFPCNFEFNSNLLLLIADEIYTGRYGTFLYDSESARNEKSVHEKTHSLWDEIRSIDLPNSPFINHFYLEGNDGDDEDIVLEPKLTSNKFHLWNDYFLRWHPSVKKSSIPTERTKQLRSLLEDLKSKVHDLEEGIEK